MATDSLLAQAAKAVVAVALVLIDEDTVVLDQAVELRPVEQVAGLVVFEILNLCRLPVGARLVDGLQLFVWVVAVTVATGVALAGMR
ncbi:hypothetical protein D3C81_1381360 [compost metagenome]